MVQNLICSKSKLDSELEKLTKIFLENGYPEDVISVYIKEKIGNFSVPGVRIYLHKHEKTATV